MADVRIWGLIAVAALASKAAPQHFRDLAVLKAKREIVEGIGDVMTTWLDESRRAQVLQAINSARAEHGATNKALQHAALSVCRLFVADSSAMRKLSEAGVEIDVDALLMVANYFAKEIISKMEEGQ